MATNNPCRPDPYFPDLDPIRELLATPPRTGQEYVAHLRQLSRQITQHVRFMCAVRGLAGSSAEQKKEAVEAFYECLRTSEEELGRIREHLELG